MTKSLSQNKMGTQPINSLLLSTSIPLIISMLVQALYNMVDSLYVSQLNQAAFNAVSLSFPIQNIMIAISAGTGTGVVALISKSLGENDREKANKLAANSMFLAACSYIAILIFGLFGVEWFFRAQTDIPEIIEGGKAYLTICCTLSFGLFFQVVFEKLTQSTGRSGLSMWIQLVGAVVNIALDPLLIFGWWIFPAMGVAGAAVATVIGQICSMIMGLVLHLKFNKDLKISLKGFRPDGRMILSIYKIGVPSMLTIGIGSVMTFLMNKLLIAIETTATAAAIFGAYFKVQSFFVMPVLGLANGMNPIIGYNLGAKNKKRMLKTYKLSVAYAMGCMILASLAFLFLPKILLSIFNASPFMLKLGVPAFKMIAPAYIFAAYGIITSQFFTACGRSMLSLIMSVSRQLVILIPVAYFIGYTFGYEYVWLSLPIGELGSTAMAVFGRIKLKKELLDKLPEDTFDKEMAPAPVIKESAPGVIITIAREHGSQGKQIGRVVAEKLGIPFYYKELTALAAEEIGFHRDFVSEINRNSPTLLRDLYLTSLPVREAIIAQDKIIRKIAENGSCVIVGRAADYVLRDDPNLVRVFLHAPKDYRINRVCVMYGDTPENAEKHINRADSARAAYYKNISGNEWGDSNNYDITLNCSAGVEATADKLIAMIREK